MWYLSKIPKVCNFYFGGRMPYLRYLSIKSFIDHNTDWKVNFYYPKYPTAELTWVTHEHKYRKNYDDCFDKVFNLKLEAIEVDMEDYDLSNKISEVHKADLMRWKLLSEGGIFSDTDILYFDSLENLAINNDYNEPVDTVVCFGRDGHHTGLLMSVSNTIYSDLYEQSIDDFNPDQYSAIGANLMNRAIPYIDADNVANLGTPSVYFLDVKTVYTDVQKPKVSIGVHWNASHPLSGQFLNKTNGGKKKTDCLISKLI